MIDLYTWNTPNGRKISIMLEACGLSYKAHPVNINEDDQFKPEFLAISPNNKIPAIIDPDGPDGAPITMFETGAILLYLSEKTGKFMPTDVRARWEVMQWLMWQMGGFGPFLGQAHHFIKHAKVDVPYARERYHKEAQRLWGVLDRRLEGREYVVDQMSVADIAIYPWAMRYEFQQITPSDYPNVARWMARMNEHEFVRRGMDLVV